MCAAIIAYIPLLIVVNTNILNRSPTVKYDRTASSGGLWPETTRSTITSARCGQRDANSHPVDLMTPIIFRVCLWSCKISYFHWHMSVCQTFYTTKTTTMYRSLVYPGERDLTKIFRRNTKINGNNRL